MNLRVIILILTVQIGCLLSFADVEHIIERGETIESIAKLYGITPDDILKANPTAKDMLYAGMVLTIITDDKENKIADNQPIYDRPSEKASLSDMTQSSTNVLEGKREIPSAWEEKHVIENEEESLFAKGRNFYGFQIAYYFPKDKKSSDGDVRTYSYGFSMMYSLRAGRYFLDNLFGDINAGFALSSSSTMQYNTHGGKGEKWEYENYSIPVNFHLGYTFPFNRRSGLSIYTGPMICFPVGFKHKVNGEKQESDIKAKTTFDWDFGVEANLASYIIGGRYSIAMNSVAGNPSAPNGMWMVYIGFVF